MPAAAQQETDADALRPLAQPQQQGRRQSRTVPLGREPAPSSANFVTRAGAGLEGVSNGDVEVADVNGDENRDLLVVGSRIATLYLQNDDGSFDEADAGLTGVGRLASASIADVDGNDEPDLLITGETDDGSATAILYLQEDGAFSEADANLTGVFESTSSVADVDDDGNPDFLITGQDANNNFTATLYYGNGDGTFDRANAGLTGVTNGGTGIADVNDDGRMDLLITGFDTNFENSARLYLQNDDGSFSTAGTNLTGTSSGSPSIVDADQDGKLDLLLVGWSGEPTATLYLQQDDGSFEPANANLTGVDGAGSAAGDVNGDDNPDLLITGGGDATLYLGTGDGTFQVADAGLTGVGGFNISASVADVDGDGDQDLLVSGTDALFGEPSTRLYVNRTQQTPPNRAPTFAEDFPFDENLAAGVSPSRTTEAGDRDGDLLSITGTGALLSIEDAENGVAEATVASDRSQIGQTFDLSVTATDSEGATASLSRSVAVPDQVAAVEADLPGFFGSGTSVADVDGDGNQDLLMAGLAGDSRENSTPTTTLYLQNDAGTFSAANANLAGVSDAATAIGDVNTDGHPDLLVTGTEDTESATLYLQNDDGSFSPANADLAGVDFGSASIADVNGDDAPDLLITGRDNNFECTSTLYYGNDDGTFTPANAELTGVCESSASIADVDANGTMDLLIAGQAETGSGSGPSTTLYLQNDDGTFAPANANLTGVHRGASSIGDVDGDGDADLLITGFAGTEPTTPSTTLYLQNDDGTFAEALAGLTNVASSATAIADVNGDGSTDLLATGLASGTFSDPENDATLYLGNGDGTFDPADAGLLAVGGGAVSVADVDGDADTDLLLTGVDGGASPTATLYENLGGGGSLPVASTTTTVSEDGTEDFGDTGTDLAFSGVSGSGEVTVNRYDEGPSGTDGISESTVSSYRVTINAGSGLSFTSAQVQLAVSVFRGIDDPTAVTIYTRDTPSSDFESLETTVGTNGTPNDVSDDTLYASTNSFSEFVLASDSEPLPVELAGFDATIGDGTVNLSWTTASETNNAGFRIQRKRVQERGGEGAWTTVGSVEGSGTTSQAQSYRFTDANLPYEADALTYRLRQVDTDGSAHLSKTVTVERGVTEVQLLGTYPNPARQQATVRFALPETRDVTIRLYDVLGRKVRTVVSGTQEGRHERTLDVGALPSGVYFLRLKAGGQTRTQKLTIAR